MRPWLVIALIACASPLGVAAPVADSPSGMSVYQSAEDHAVTEGDLVIDGDPGELYNHVLDYSRWTDIFPDVAKVVVTQKEGVDARVTLIAPDGHRDNLHFHNQPAARMVWFEDTGGRATVWAEIMFVPGPSSGTTRIHTRLFAQVNGLVSLVVPDGNVRKMRETRIQRQLVHMREYFAHRKAMAGA